MEIQAALYWSESLLERFEANRGYSPIKYLPFLFDKSTSFGSHAAPYDTTYLLVGSSDNGQNQYLQDYRTTLNEGYIEYLQTLEAWARSIGLSHSCQVAYNVPVDMVSVQVLLPVRAHPVQRANLFSLHQRWPRFLMYQALSSSLSLFPRPI